ncbi:MAG: TlpA family protein disulfide reductase [Bacteroidales bacterium]|nr:TlpA family protein disulfide reductase [Bacteroidales bacterium]
MRIFLLIVLLSSAPIYAQHMLKAKIECSDKMINISRYFFNDKKHVGTIKIDSTGYYLKDFTNFPKGEYNLKNSDIDIDFIFNNEEIVFIDNCEDENYASFIKSDENISLNNFFSFYYDNKTAFGLLKQLLNFYPENDIFYADILSRKNDLYSLNMQYIDSLIQAKPKSLSSEIAKLYKNNSTGFVDIEQDYSTGLIKTRFLGDKILSYLGKYERENITREKQQELFLPAIDTILLSFKRNEILLLYVADFLIDKFRYYDLDLVYEYTALKTKQLIDVNSIVTKDKNIEQIIFNLNNIVNSMVGNKAYNFVIDKNKKLYDLKSKKKLVVFWASWCPHCEETLIALKENIKDIAPEIQIITYSLDYENNPWVAAMKGYPKKWINICDCNNSEKVPDKYSIYATPSLILLDEDNTIVAKPRDYLNLLDYIGNE